GATGLGLAAALGGRGRAASAPLRLCVRFLLVCVLVTSGSSLISAQDSKPVDFAHDVVPILRKHCSECHTGDKKKGGFSFNDRTALLAGGESGPAIVVGK